MPAPKRIAAHLRNSFTQTTRRRGQRYFEDGRVGSLESDGDVIASVVLGSEAYDTSLELCDNVCRASCSCPAFDQYGPCKHLWALVLAIDYSREILRENGSRGDHRRGADRGEWRERLHGVLTRVVIEAPDPWQGLASPVVELAYLLEVDGPDDQGIRVAVVRRRRRSNGRWGRWRPYIPNAPDTPSLHDPADWRLVDGLLSASDGSPSNPWRSSFESRREAGRFTLAGAVADAVLPELVRSRRCFAARSADVLHVAVAGGDWDGPVGDLASGGGDLHDGPRNDGPRALALDEGAPWSLGLRLTRDEDSGQCRLHGSLEREEDVLPLASVGCILTERYLLAAGVVRPFSGSIGWLRSLRPGPIVAPLSEEGELIRAVQELPGPPVHGALQAAPEPVHPVPHLWVENPDHATNYRPLLRCRIAFDYGGRRVDMSDPRPVVRLPESTAQRDLEAERAALRVFLEQGVPFEDDEDLECTAAILARELPAAVGALLEAGWTVEADGVPYRSPGSVRLSVSSGVDWFDLEGGLEFEGEFVPLPALLEATKRGLRMIQLGDGSFGVLPEKWLDDWGLLDSIAEERGGGFRFTRSQGWILDALLATRSDVEVDRCFGQWRERIAGFRGVESAREGATFRGTLRDYQREGLGWLRFLTDVGFGGCLADDMGLGKTVQVLALLAARAKGGRKEPKPALVVAPRSVVDNWVEEAARFTPELRVLAYVDRERKQWLDRLHEYDLVVTTYGVLRRDILALQDRQFGHVILDEAQAIKNDRSQAAKAARLLRAEHRLALSGTPIENHLGELWSLFEFLNPGMLGRAKTFRDLVRRTEFGAKDRAALAVAIRPFLLRRTKEEVLSELPEKTEQTLHCELAGRQRKEYGQLRDHYRGALLAGGGVKKIQVLEALLRLRQAACHPGLLDPARTSEASAKLDALMPMLEEVCESGHKALVFSQFTSFLAIVRARLDAAKLRYEYLDGRTRKRKERIDRFQSDPDCRLFLISLKAGGLGLNLTAADYVFLLDPWWNPAVESQAIDRAHRMGQMRNVSAYRLICRDTVEERVLELQKSKRELADAIIGGDTALMRDLTREDLERLLS